MQVDFQFLESLQNLRANPLRSALSIVGVVFGVASVVAMLAIGMGAEAEVEKLLDSLGAHNIHISSKDLNHEEWRSVIKSTIGLSDRDYQIVQEMYPSQPITKVAEWSTNQVNLHMDTPKLAILGVTPNYRQVLGIKLAAGRSFTDLENYRGSPVGLIGQNRARQWFGDSEKALGEMLRVDNAWFEIIGVIAEKVSLNATDESQSENVPQSSNDINPQSSSNGNTGSDIKDLGLKKALVIPLESASRRLGRKVAPSPLERLVLKLPKDLDPIVARRQILDHLRRLHRDATVVEVTAAEEVIDQKRSTSRLFSYFLMTIALISLVVGGIGIANVMLASMVERIREVGLRRAIGAKRHHILWQFLTEALTICLIGGILGGLGGLGVAYLIGYATSWTIIFPWWGMVIAIVISTIVGLASGLYPALSASRISPIEALQGKA